MTLERDATGDREEPLRRGGGGAARAALARVVGYVWLNVFATWSGLA